MKYLGVDWGLKRIGLAISEGIQASSYKTLEVSSLEDAALRIQKIVEFDNIDQVVIGRPESGHSAQLVKKAVKKLQSLGLEVIEVDETLSTQEAKQLILEQNLSKKPGRDDNAYSAMLILQNYLDEKK